MWNYKVMFGIAYIWQFSLLFSLFLLLLIGLIALFSTIMGFIVLSQLIFSFIYSTFNKKFSVSAKLAIPKRT